MHRNEPDRRQGRLRRDIEEKRLCSPLFVITLILKILLVIQSIIVLVLVADYNTSWMIIYMTAVMSCTLLYVAVSVMVEFFITCTCPNQNPTCHIAETVCNFLFLVSWLLACGIATQVSLSAGSRTTELFGWVGACTGIGTGLFIATSALYCLQIIPIVRYGKI